MIPEEIEIALDGPNCPEKDRAIVAALMGGDTRLKSKAIAEIDKALNGPDRSEKDRAIVAALKGDDTRLQTKAVKELLTQLRPMLGAYTSKNSGTWKDGTDLADEVVGILYENIQADKYEQRDGAKLCGYCYRIGMNIWLKGIRDDDDASLDDELPDDDNPNDDNPEGVGGYTPPNGEDPSASFDDVEYGKITSPAMQKAWRAFNKLEPACQRIVRLELDGLIDEEVLKEFPGMTVDQLLERRLRCKKEWLRLIKKEPPVVLDKGLEGPCLERAFAGLTLGQRELLDMDRKGLTETQIQEAYNFKSLLAVRVKRSRAKARLNKLYNKCMNGHRDKPSDGTPG